MCVIKANQENSHTAKEKQKYKFLESSKQTWMLDPVVQQP